VKTAMLWMALGTVCLLLSAHAAFGQRVRLPSDTSSQGSVVTLAQAPSSTASATPSDASPTPASSAPSTFNSPSPGTSSAAAMAAPSTYGNAGAPGYGSPSTYGSNQPNMGSPGSAAAPAYSAPTLAPSASLGGTITPAPVPWDPYAAGGSGGACPPAVGPMGAAPGACVPCLPVQACAEFPWHVFGEFLYLEPRNTDVPYAIPVNAGGVQNGSTGIANPDYTPAFRIGFTRDLYDNTSSLGASWTRFYSSDNDSINVAGTNNVNSLVLAAPPAGLYKSASASYNIDYDLVDLDYRGVFISSNRYVVNFLLGARYARLEQDFGGTFTGVAPLKDNVNTGISFTGGGVRVGLEGERYAARSGLMVYGRTAASFMAGKFDANYTETGTSGTANSEIVSDRVVPILELELGVGWVSPSGHFRISGGYLFNAWYNVMRTTDLVSAVQAGSYSSNLNTITFDGLVLHAEARY